MIILWFLIMCFGKWYLRVLNFLELTSWSEQTEANNLWNPTKFWFKKILYSFVVLLLKNIDSFWLSFADEATTRTNNFVSLLVKSELSGLSFSLSLPAAGKTQ